MVQGRVYIRVHTEVRVATSAELSDLILKRNHARLRNLLQENDNLSSLILKVSKLSAEIFKTNNLIDEIAFNTYCAQDMDLRNFHGKDVVALVNEGGAILTNLETVEIANLTNYIIDVNHLIEELSQINVLMDEALNRYYEEVDTLESNYDE